MAAAVARTRVLPHPDGTEYVVVRRSSVHGRGLFAARDLPKGSPIIEYTGEKITRAEGERRAEKQWQRGRIYVFRLNQRYDIDGAGRENAARLANFSCDPNAESLNVDGKRIWIHAMRAIAAGEEITYDYYLDFEEPPARCRCASPLCIGYMVSQDALPQLEAWLLATGRTVPKALAARLHGRVRAAKQG
jgi:hypothetical protein